MIPHLEHAYRRGNQHSPQEQLDGLRRLVDSSRPAIALPIIVPIRYAITIARDLISQIYFRGMMRTLS